MGLPTERARTLHKYKLDSAPEVSAFPVHTEVFDIEKTMLSDEHEHEHEHEHEQADSPSSSSSDCPNPLAGDRILYSFLRKRSQGGFHAYGLTTVKQLSTGETVQLKCILTPHLYSTLLASRKDPYRQVVKQRRYCFRTDDQCFHVSQWLEPACCLPEGGAAWFAVIQCEAEDPVVPAYLSVGPEFGTMATQGREFSFRELSLLK